VEDILDLLWEEYLQHMVTNNATRSIKVAKPAQKSEKHAMNAWRNKQTTLLQFRAFIEHN